MEHQNDARQLSLKERSAAVRWRRLAGNGYLLLYTAAIVVFALPLLVGKLMRFVKYRFIKKKFSRELDWTRWSCPPLPAALPSKNEQSHNEQADSTKERTGRPPHIVFVGVGFGEMGLMNQLTNALKQTYPQARVTWAVAGHNRPVARQTYPDQDVTVIPFDFVVPVLRWLRRLEPDVVVMVERFWHPTLVWCAADWGARVLVVSGKEMRPSTRPHPYDTWRGKLWLPLHKSLVERFTSLCLQDEGQLHRLERVLPAGADARVTGNIKFDLERPVLAPARRSALARWLGKEVEVSQGEVSRQSEVSLPHEVPLLAAGSTHLGEEDLVLRAFQMVRREVPCALLLAPRYLERVNEVLEIIASFGLQVSRRSQSEELAQDDRADVYVLDTLGELAASYEFVQAAYVGGTLHGAGHNVVEPLLWGAPVSYGPGSGRGKPSPAQRVCDEAGVGFRVRSPDELAAHWKAVLQDSALRDEMRRRAARLLDEERGALEKNVASILEAVAASGVTESGAGTDETAALSTAGR